MFDFLSNPDFINTAIGYIHHPLKQNAKTQIICDPERYKIVRELSQLIETGAYSIMALKKVAERMGLLNNKGRPYSLKTYHFLFKNPMYYGKFY